MKQIPTDINLDILHKDGKIAYKGYNSKHMEEIIALIVEKEYYSYLFDHAETHIHSDNFKAITNQYKRYLDILEAENHLFIHNKYAETKYSKSYSINSQYTEFLYLDDIWEEEVVKRKLKKEGRKMREGEMKGEKIEKPFIYYEKKQSLLNIDSLIDWFSFLKLDYDNAILEAEGIRERLTLFPEFKYAKKWTEINNKSVLRYEKLKVCPKRVYSNHSSCLAQFRDRRFYEIYRDDTVGRLYNPFTSLAKQYRKYLSINDKEMGAVDISNCQPFLALLLLNPSFWYFDELPEEVKEKFIKSFPLLNASAPITIESIGYKENAIKYIKYDRLLKAHKNLGPDYEIFKNEVLKGNLYQYMADALEKNDSIRRDIKEMKPIIFIVLFTANQYIGQIEAEPKRIFKQLFPTIYSILSVIKSINSPLLACILQRIESHLILDVIVPSIQKDLPHLPIYTIHDSICSYSTETEYIANKISDAFVDNMGYAPHLKKENWKKSKIL